MQNKTQILSFPHWQIWQFCKSPSFCFFLKSELGRLGRAASSRSAIAIYPTSFTSDTSLLYCPPLHSHYLPLFLPNPILYF